MGFVCLGPIKRSNIPTKAVPVFFYHACYLHDCDLYKCLRRNRLADFCQSSGDRCVRAPRQPSPVSSHDPSAAPIIPRAKTRWKKAASAGEQCFGNKTPERRLRIPYTHAGNRLRSCVGKWCAGWAFIGGERCDFCRGFGGERSGPPRRKRGGCSPRGSIIVSLCMGRNAGFPSGQLAAN